MKVLLCFLFAFLAVSQAIPAARKQRATWWPTACFAKTLKVEGAPGGTNVNGLYTALKYSTWYPKYVNQHDYQLIRLTLTEWEVLITELGEGGDAVGVTRLAHSLDDPIPVGGPSLVQEWYDDINQKIRPRMKVNIVESDLDTVYIGGELGVVTELTKVEGKDPPEWSNGAKRLYRSEEGYWTYEDGTGNKDILGSSGEDLPVGLAQAWE